MENAAESSAPDEIEILRDISDPDRALDELIAKCPDDSPLRARLEGIKELDRDLKVRWLLALPEPGAGSTRAVCVEILVFVTVVTWVIVTVAGVAKRVRQERQEQRKKLKCTGDASGTPDIGSGTPDIGSGTPDTGN